ncbi:MAG: CpsD/CapB family tyrosine-protein kinase [Acidobacteriaceae bacterium]|nr:CpsD/CapB family tyrosine-protein kinase [Acidobacteriaceae bacterium]MBV9502634.1 CpsD/CapB family tyrosine-protein kinase [Acidobacteriaceae bacterium]
MSRIHDALRKAAQQNPPAAKVSPPPPTRTSSVLGQGEPQVAVPGSAEAPAAAPSRSSVASSVVDPLVVMVDPEDLYHLDEIIKSARQAPYDPLGSALLVNPAKPREAPAEEFRSLRTRLNHLQTMQPLHTLVVTSGSPAEGKSFTASNLAIAQSQLADKRVLLADFDFRRPSVDKTFRLPSSPGITDYLQGKARLADLFTKIGDTNLYVITAGGPVANPLELLNLKESAALIQALGEHFDWVILDSPPLLFAADANLLATICDGSILVVRIGHTTFDSVTRAMQSLCENNILGVVVNGARRGELYSKYAYYHDYYYDAETGSSESETGEQEAVSVDSVE